MGRKTKSKSGATAVALDPEVRDISTEECDVVVSPALGRIQFSPGSEIVCFRLVA